MIYWILFDFYLVNSVKKYFNNHTRSSLFFVFDMNGYFIATFVIK
jgi:hypothetical protein